MFALYLNTFLRYVKYKSYCKRHKDIVAAHNLSERQALVEKGVLLAYQGWKCCLIYYLGKAELEQCRIKCSEAEKNERELSEREKMREELHRFESFFDILHG